MNTVRIEVNGLDITALAEKLDTLTNVLTGQTAPEPSTPENNNLITRRETAKILGVTLPTVIDWEKKGIITGYRIGNRIRYKEAEILEAVTNNKTR
ncbi:helix-turn-helix domain-containing protein [Soonwooa sp.]|uniref:helix-turn-helix domain-containing protein n=1 Tax=Soonwooa sp. TaxID=1938592 RepID=UPI00289E2A7B|nr:helix-turn-helix domain-containing protein [Soonwooa sp.]